MTKSKVACISALTALILVFMVSLSACGGQSSSNENTNIIDSKTAYEIIVPTQVGEDTVNVFFSLPFYQVCSEETKLAGDDEWDNVQDFTVGDNVEVSGENVDAIEGMTISITQSPLKEVVGDEEEYIDALVDSYEKSMAKKSIKRI